MAQQFNQGIPVRGSMGPQADHMRAYPFTPQDQGGPREKAAHESNQEFLCLVRWDGGEGYIFHDPRSRSQISGKRIDADGHQLAEKTVTLFLRQVDGSAFCLESRSKDLDLIRRERELIVLFRRQGYDDPFKSAEQRLALEEKVWDKAKEAGIKASDWVDAEIQGIDPKGMKTLKAYDGGSLSAIPVGAPQEMGVTQPGVSGGSGQGRRK